MSLRRLGWGPFFESQLMESERSLLAGRIVEEQRGFYRVRTSDGDFWAEASERRQRELERAGEVPTVGDWVLARPRHGEDRVSIVRRLDRRSKLSRKAPGSREHEQLIAVNFDTAILMTSLNADLSLRRLERALTLVWESGGSPAIVLTKADLAPDREARIAEVRAIAGEAPVHAVSVVSREGLDAIREYFTDGRTVLLVGSSGVGKSSLVNALAGEAVQTTGTIRETDGKGRHTTSARRLMTLPSGGHIIDTPGMRELQLWGGEEGLLQAFDNIEEVARGCKFTDCGHASEPGCAVKAALEGGALSTERVGNYLKLLGETREPASRPPRRPLPRGPHSRRRS